MRSVVRSCASPSAACATRPRSVVTGAPTSVSRPGRIVRALTEAKAMNPVVLIDEIDKLQAGGWSGDPASALLEVLDPAQNHTFRDHYLELDLDLSDVLFLATANHARHDPRTVARPHGDRARSTATPRTRRSRSPSTTCSRASARRRACATTSSTITDDAFHALVERLDARGRCARSRTADRQDRAQGRAQDRRPSEATDASSSTSPT